MHVINKFQNDLPVYIVVMLSYITKCLNRAYDSAHMLHTCENLNIIAKLDFYLSCYNSKILTISYAWKALDVRQNLLEGHTQLCTPAESCVENMSILHFYT